MRRTAAQGPALTEDLEGAGAQWTLQRALLVCVAACRCVQQLLMALFRAGREPLAITVAATTRTDARLWISPGIASNYGAPIVDASHRRAVCCMSYLTLRIYKKWARSSSRMLTQVSRQGVLQFTVLAALK